MLFLQSLVKGLEKKGESSEGDSEYADAVAAQVSLSYNMKIRLKNALA